MLLGCCRFIASLSQVAGVFYCHCVAGVLQICCRWQVSGCCRYIAGSLQVCFRRLLSGQGISGVVRFIACQLQRLIDLFQGSAGTVMVTAGVAGGSCLVLPDYYTDGAALL